MIILLNGPAGCGKDTLAKLLLESKAVQGVLEFKAPMFDIALVASGLSPEEWRARYNDRTLKELPWERLGGMSCREFMIHISEAFIKPAFGQDYFGKQLASKYLNVPPVHWDVAVSDSGFHSELAALSAEVGAENILLVRLWREGYNFDGDSRMYLNALPGNHLVDLQLIEGYPSQTTGNITCVMNAIKRGSNNYQTR